MSSSEIDLAKKPHSFLYRAVRAVIIGFIAYYGLGFLYMCSRIDTKMIGSALQAHRDNVRQQQEAPFRPWTGKAPELPSEAERRSGFNWAEKYNVRDYQLCKKTFPGDHKVYERSGCIDRIHKVLVVDVLKTMPTVMKNNSNDDTTTEYCRRVMGARQDLIIGDMIARGDMASVRAYDGGYGGEVSLEECENFDNIHVGRIVNEPLGRVYDWKRNISHGAKFTEQDRQQLAKDYLGVVDFPNKFSKPIYMAEVEILFQMVGGKDYVLGIPGAVKLDSNPGYRIIKVTCEEYRKQIKQFESTDKSISQQEQNVDRKKDESTWQTLNSQRVANMGLWGKYTMDAQPLGCE